MRETMLSWRGLHSITASSLPCSHQSQLQCNGAGRHRRMHAERAIRRTILALGYGAVPIETARSNSNTAGSANAGLFLHGRAIIIAPPGQPSLKSVLGPRLADLVRQRAKVLKGE